MRIRAKEALTIRDAETGELTSIPYGGDMEVDSTVAEALITDGLAEEYTTVSPTGLKEVDVNGVFDVFNYANVSVNVPQSGGVIQDSVTFNNLRDESVTIPYMPISGDHSSDSDAEFVTIEADGTTTVSMERGTMIAWRDFEHATLTGGLYFAYLSQDPMGEGSPCIIVHGTGILNIEGTDK